MKTKKKKVDFSVRPRAATEALPPDPEKWVKEGGEPKEAREEKEPDAGTHKRLTLNLPAALHTAFKSRCVIEDVTIQDKVRQLIERELESDRLTPTGEGAL